MEKTDASSKADLHSHTSFSDGYLTPEELIQKASECGIQYLAITDHDNIDAYERASAAGNQYNVTVIPATEISAEHNGEETHILAYFIDYKDIELTEYLKEFRVERIKRAEKIIEKLNELGIPLKKGEVFKKIKGGASIGRPHIAVTLVEAGFVNSYYDAFQRYLGDGKPAYVKKKNISARDAISLINRCGGLSFIAHPGRNLKDSNTLFELIEMGIDGIEVVHPSHTESDTEYFKNIASQYFLLESGGSDFHGGKINDESLIGKYFVDGSKITAMKNRLFHK
jgi:predicted metal-dependent phosphoesterase TrpH